MAPTQPSPTAPPHGGAASPGPVGPLLLAAALVLACIVVVVTTLSIGRSEATMVTLLADKGAALIRAFDGALRTGMRSQVGVRLQSMLQEMVGTDILFAAVTMPDGTIIAHSTPERLGEILEQGGQEVTPQTMAQYLGPIRDGEVHWHITEMEGRHAFVVYRYFAPRPPRAPLAPPIIFLGLDVTPFESMRAAARLHLLLVSGGMILVGFAGLLALYFADRARESRRRQREAEGQVRLLEEEVRRKEKLAAIGNLAAGVAHEIRNPLSSIKGYATYFGQRFPAGSEDREAATVMVREVERLNRVITDLIGLSRPTDVHMRPADITPLVEHALRLLRQDMDSRHITPELDAPPNLPLVRVDADRFGQALLNVCLNAIESMPEGGRLRISLKPERTRLRLDVEDTGHGILPQDVGHIFDPYFTTKGHGTGLGLATVHKIIEAHGGEITVHSRHKSQSATPGTCCSIYLPLAGEEAQARQDGHSPEQGATHDHSPAHPAGG